MFVTSTKLALVDDHKLFRKGLRSLIEIVSQDYKILFEADDGLDLQHRLDERNLPDIVLMDINMPRMDGFESVQWIRSNYPQIHILVVSMTEKEETIVRMVKLGVKGYLSKDVEPDELGAALKSIKDKGHYYTDYVTGKLVHSLQNTKIEPTFPHSQTTINPREQEFLNWACSELTYYQIADKMFLSPKTIDGYRNSLFEKLNVKSRVGLALYAVKHGLVAL